MLSDPSPSVWTKPFQRWSGPSGCFSFAVSLEMFLNGSCATARAKPFPSTANPYPPHLSAAALLLGSMPQPQPSSADQRGARIKAKCLATWTSVPSYILQEGFHGHLIDLSGPRNRSRLQSRQPPHILHRDAQCWKTNG